MLLHAGTSRQNAVSLVLISKTYMQKYKNSRLRHRGRKHNSRDVLYRQSNVGRAKMKKTQKTGKSQKTDKHDIQGLTLADIQELRIQLCKL